jgi:hypothetical protein
MIKNLKEKKVIIKNIKIILASMLIMPLMLLGVVAVSAPAYADNCPGGNADVNNNPLKTGTACAKGSGQTDSITNVFKVVVNILLFIVGAVAVIMLVIGGLRYVTSNGDQNAVTGAKNTILYAIIGIVVAFLAFAAVTFVTDQLSKSDDNGVVSAG